MGVSARVGNTSCKRVVETVAVLVLPAPSVALRVRVTAPRGSRTSPAKNPLPTFSVTGRAPPVTLTCVTAGSLTKPATTTEGLMVLAGTVSLSVMPGPVVSGTFTSTLADKPPRVAVTVA